MGMRLEVGLRGRADALSGRVRRDQFRMFGFQVGERAQELIVLRIGEFGLVEDLVAVVGVIEPRPQILRARGGFLEGV